MSHPDASTRDRLWHYTTTDGLLGIINTRQIWATDAQYLNDTRELVEGAERLAAEASTALADPAPSSSRVRDLWLQLHRVLGEDARVEMPSEGPYVACFCSDGDLLSQWRGYANGGGYAIGFSTAGLKAAAESAKGALVQVVYDPPKLGDNGLFRASALTVGGMGARMVPTSAALAKFKHPAFREEHEWRAVFPANDDASNAGVDLNVKFRSGALGVVPYLEIDVPREAIIEVRVGPGGDQELRRLAVERLLSAAQIPASTSVSAAPFRG